MSDKEYTPFKCPDCKVWWRSETHKCEPPRVAVTVKPGVTVEETGGGFVIKPSSKISYSTPKYQYCQVCQKPLGKTKETRCKGCGNQDKNYIKKWDRGHQNGKGYKTYGES